MRLLRFLLNTFLLSVSALTLSWFIEGAFYTYHYSQAEPENVTHRIVLPSPPVEPFLEDANFLLLGIAGKPYPAPYLTDTIIVGSFQTDPSGLTLTSIPRDLFVQVPGGTYYTRINSLYEIGRSFSPLEPERFIKEKVEEITGLSIDYYALIDVIGLEALIDAVGGVDIEVEKPIADPFFPGPNLSYEPFYLEAGAHHLDGHDAVRFARSRYTPRGDFERIERQQTLLNALKKQVTTQGISLEEAIGVFGKLENHLFTNMKLRDIPLVLISLFSLEGEEIRSATIDAGPEGLLQFYRTSAGASVLIPKAGMEEYGEIGEFFKQMSNF